MADDRPPSPDNNLTVLALDSAGSACSAAIWHDGRLVAHRFAEMEHGHAEALMPMVQAVMAEAGLAYDALDLIAAGTGPGSYTGVRVGLAAARAIASAAGKPLSGVSNFDAIFAACAPEQPDIVALETRRADLYVQLFADGRADSPPVIVTEDGLAALFKTGGPVLIAGDASRRAAEVLIAAGCEARIHPQAHHADAGVIADLAGRRWQREHKPRPADPIYLRPPDARTVAERAAAKQAEQAARQSGAMQLMAAGPVHGPVMAALQQKCFDDRWSTEAMTALLSQPGVAGSLLVAADSQVPLGYGLIRVAAGEAEILTFGVDPHHRRSGHGRRILDHLIGQAQAAGAEMVFLEVAETNRAARTLYERRGFIAVGRRSGYYRGAHGIDDGLTYRLDLRPPKQSLFAVNSLPS